MADGNETTAMELDAQMVSPMDDSYLESLEEPWKSMALQAISPLNSADANAASRLDQLELGVRSQLLRLFFDLDPSEKVEKVGEFWKAALNLCLHMVHHSSQSKEDPRYADMNPRKLPVLLIEDCLNALTVEDAKKFWVDYVEPSLDSDHPPQLLGELFWKSSTVCHLPLLRVCNQFLRVLDTDSYSDHYEYKGRVLIMLAKSFSIADRSALKFWGTFNSANANDYENEETFLANSTPTKTKASGASSKMDYSLYESFWSLQADFANPNRIQVAAFIRKLKIVLEALESAASSRSTSTTTPLCTSVRYMTSSSLLPTQLATPEFRSSVLTQFIITASHLSSESLPLADALAPLLTRAKKLLLSDNPELYHLLLESILAHREDAWRKWKKEKCPVSAFAPKHKPKPQSESTVSPDKDNMQLLITGALGHSEAPAEHEYESLQTDELLKISQDLKKAIPSLEGHLEPYVDALDPESGIEPEYHPKNDSLFAWRAMRLFAKHQLPLLKQCRRPADLERITREWYRQQGKEIPGEMPPEPLEEGLEDDGADDPDKADDKGSEMEEDEREKGEQEGMRHSSDDEHEKDATSPVVDAEMNNQDDGLQQEKKLHEKEEGDIKDDTYVDRVSVEGKEETGDTHARDLAKSNTTGVDDNSTNDQDSDAASDYGRAKECNRKDSKATSREETKDAVKEKVNVEFDGKSALEGAVSKAGSDDNKSDKKGSAKIEISAVEDKASDDSDGSRRRRSSSRKRRRSRSEERDRNKVPIGPSREYDGNQDRDRRDRPRGPGNRGLRTRNDSHQRGRGRNDLDEGHPQRGGRGGAPPPPRRDDGTHPHGRGGRGGRSDDGPHGRPGRIDGQPPPRRQEDGPPPGRGGVGRGGERDREGDRRRGRDNSRPHGRR